MHRNPGPNSGPSSSFVNGDPVAGTPGTIVDGGYMTSVQEELAGFVEGQGLTLDVADNTQLQTAILQAITTTGLRNPLINPGFDVWQRGTTATVSAGGKYTADRWFQESSLIGNSTLTTSRVAAAPGDIGVTLPQGTKHFIEIDWAAGGGGGARGYLEQRIENVRRYAGKVLNVSFYAKRKNAGTNVLVIPRIVQNFGSGGSPQVITTGTNQNVLTGVWARYDTTIAVPTIAGKIIGSSGDDWLGIRLEHDIPDLSAGGHFAQVEVHVGTAPPPAEIRPTETELALCMRYFQKSYNVDTAPGSNAGAGVLHGHDVSGPNIQPLQRLFPVRMRASPSVVWYAPTGQSTALT